MKLRHSSGRRATGQVTGQAETQATTAAPTGRKKLAQGKERSDDALGNDSPNASSPEPGEPDYEYYLFDLGDIWIDGPREPGKETFWG